MSDVFLGQILLVPYNFAPKGYAFCAGQIMSISQNTALFSLLGTTYGGNGTSNFALPNLQGNSPLGQGQGPGLGLYLLGEVAGTTNVTLLQTEMPLHNHPIHGNPAQIPAAVGDPTNHSPGQAASTAVKPYNTGPGNVQLNPACVTPNGGSQPHNNLMPYLVLNWVIALQGIFPARS